jgi:hypothetical protein
VRGFLRHLEAHRRGLEIALDEIGRTARDETVGAGEPLHWVVTAVKSGRDRDA